MQNNINVVTVTPELAEDWLLQNTHNRNLRKNHVEGLAKDMESGRWQWNGEAVKFSNKNVLLDGQHRLAAIIKSGVTIDLLVITGIVPESQHTMDTGSKRSASDMLRLNGEKRYTALAAGIRSCIIWDSGVRAIGGGYGQAVTNSMVLEYLENNPEVREYNRQYSQIIDKEMKIPASVGVLIVKLFNEIDPEDAEHFFKRLASDEGHYRGEPIYALRRALSSSESKTEISRSLTWKLAVSIKAWNKYRLGEELKVLSYRPGGASKEKFPEPI